MKDIINIIENTLPTTEKTNGNDQLFQITMLAIATILVSLLEWFY